MPEVKFGLKSEPSMQFNKSKDLIAIRTFSKKPLTRSPVANPVSRELSKNIPVLTFPEAGVEVYRVPEKGLELLEGLKAEVRALPDVRFAGGVFVDAQSGEPIVYTENLFIKFVDAKPEEDCIAVIVSAELKMKEKLTYAQNTFFVGAPEGSGEKVFDIALSLLEREDVEYCHPEIIRRRSRRAIALQQWHLKTVELNGRTITASANVEKAHAITQGAGITIAVIDDGIDIDHLEFRSEGKIVSPRDVTKNSSDPRPKDTNPRYPDDHGTACAGVACADGKFGASGVAPLAKLMPIREASGLGSKQESDAFRWAADNGADIISCSWGPQDGDWWDPTDPFHQQVAPLPVNMKLAIDYAVKKGRGGKGCVILFAAGNGNESVDNDGYASYEKVIAVAACNDTGKRSVYSDFGKAVWCSFPSGDFDDLPLHPKPLTPGIWTTDRSGSRGYNAGAEEAGDAAGNFTNSFSGTSSACPGAAGIAALILSVNPALNWREVKDILKGSCDQIDPEGGNYVNDKSELYGYGRLNAETAVNLARPNPAALNRSLPIGPPLDLRKTG
ncbi:MAG TPA: S8 family serine peptidase [Pyrinomonadaceae bacterium]|jgi:subtilisin family serine protease|nr:S8 family serine peptidase [Pyrinomonadaceae bacterium]